MDEYVSPQRSKGRISAREAEGIFDLHVVEAWPAIAQAPASDLTQEHVVDMLRRLVEQGKGRTSNKLRTYWRLIEKLPRLRGRCLRLHLLTGGQRIEQLVRLRWADVRADAITIHDTKGRPGQGPRAHTVPLTKGAAPGRWRHLPRRAYRADLASLERDG